MAAAFATSMALSVADKLIEILTSEAVKKVRTLWGYQKQIDELVETITSIKLILLDAESKRDSLSELQRGYIAELTDMVYDAEDLFDEVRTLAELDQIGKCTEDKFTAKVRLFFKSNKGKFSRAKKLSRRVIEIKNHLDATVSNFTRFGFSVNSQPIVRRREDTCSYVTASDIVGREELKDRIVDALVGPSSDDHDLDGFCSTLVGVGGVGKTALAQLVFSDARVVGEFGDERFWVCVADTEGVQFDVRDILSRLLELTDKGMSYNSFSMELVQNQFQEKFRERKYLLVLDDVWNEDRGNWVKLHQFLIMGKKGSKVVVTSRSMKTGNITGGHIFRLEGLSTEHSQLMFEMTAFGGGAKSLEKVEIGKRIVEKCCGIPLAIKVLGSLLYGEGLSKWKFVENSRLIDVRTDGGNGILPILKLSYDSLAPSLKSCFTYCAIFPKDFRMEKLHLIGLWLAQGYIVPLSGNQTLEDAADEHFYTLMRRCFFQDIDKDHFGNVVSVKIHDLLHDIAVEVGKEEIYIATSERSRVNDKVRHVNVHKCGEISLNGSKIRSYICNWSDNRVLDKQVVDLVALRVLDLSYLDIKSLPDTIDRLLLLRYIDLTHNSELEVLPNSIVNLHNLQTLILRYCYKLREVPEEVGNLVNLRHLDCSGCQRLNRMPLSILRLKNLVVLPHFVARVEIPDEELKGLQQPFNELKGKIQMVSNGSESRIGIHWGYVIGEWAIGENAMRKLQLPMYLNELSLEYFETIPWPEISLSHLVKIYIGVCEKLEQIPVLSKLPNLQFLHLSQLNSVEFMENEITSSSNNSDAMAEWFPSLKSLIMENLPKLKAWWKVDIMGMRLKFPLLSYLKITDCPDLRLNLIGPPVLEELILYNNSEWLVVHGELGKLRSMEMDKMEYLKLLSPPNNCLTHLMLRGDIDVESAMEHVRICASSLQGLAFISCKNMRRLPRLDHFTALEWLLLYSNEELSFCEDAEASNFLPQSIRGMTLWVLPQITNLPIAIQHLTSLQSLELDECESIKSLPEAMKDLTSLETLRIRRCPLLKTRCQKPNGEDFHKIQHISNIFINYGGQLTSSDFKG